MKHVYTENYKSLMNKIKDTGSGRIFRVRELNDLWLKYP